MIILASASPRRKELLSQIVNEFKIIPSEIDEESIIDKNMNVKEIPEFLSTKKAIDVLTKYKDDIIIAADTAIILNDKIYGKPSNIEEAFNMLKLFSNNTHQVITGVCVATKNKTISFSSINEVTFYNLTDQEIKEYLQLGEYTDKAGAYAIQGKGNLLIKNIKGDFNSIIGLPISELNRILKNFFY